MNDTVLLALHVAMKATINAGTGTVNLRLPPEIGARVEVQAGPHTVTARDLTQEGDVYTNSAYGVSDVTLQVDLSLGSARSTWKLLRRRGG